MIVSDARIVAFDGGQKMQVRTFPEVFFDTARGKPLICHENPFANVIVADECRVGTGIDAVSRNYLGTNRLHQLNVIGSETPPSITVRHTGLFSVFYRSRVRYKPC